MLRDSRLGGESSVRMWDRLVPHRKESSFRKRPFNDTQLSFGLGLVLARAFDFWSQVRELDLQVSSLVCIDAHRPKVLLESEFARMPLHLVRGPSKL